MIDYLPGDRVTDARSLVPGSWVLCLDSHPAIRQVERTTLRLVWYAEVPGHSPAGYWDTRRVPVHVATPGTIDVFRRLDRQRLVAARLVAAVRVLTPWGGPNRVLTAGQLSAIEDALAGLS